LRHHVSRDIQRRAVRLSLRAHFRDLLKMASQSRGIIDESHDEMIRGDVVEIAGMNEDAFLFEQTRSGALFISPDRDGDVKTAARLNERNALETVDGLAAALPDPSDVTFQKLLAAVKDFGHRKLRDFINREKCVGNEFESRKGLADEERFSADRHPSDLHSRKRKQLRKSIERENQRRFRSSGARKFIQAEKK